VSAIHVIDEIPIVDTDSHVSEPEDLWVSRVSARWGDRVPKVVWDEDSEEFRWLVGDSLLSSVAEYAQAGWHEPFPSYPPTLAEADSAAYDPHARLKRMDEYGISAQVLYPNVIGFDLHAFLTNLGPELTLDCVRAYNDFLIEFASADPNRLVPIMMMPMWDPEACVAELRRAHGNGHRGVLFGALLKRIGIPNISDPMWDPLLSEIAERDLSVNLHIGFTVRTKERSETLHAMLTKKALAKRTDLRSFVARQATNHSSVIEAASEIILRGVCQRHPDLKFVSVESGFGYWPYVLDHLDWFWHSSGAVNEFSDMALPSEYWLRQFYATFWFERSTVSLLDRFQDNAMFESDYPHETSLSPGLGCAKSARNTAAENLAELPDVARRKVLYENAARIYHLDNLTAPKPNPTAGPLG
jgi:uncharacterized protein